jgi:hypothetical protein
MTDPAPRIDFADLPAPAEGILVTLFITVRKVARSRDFYSRVLGGTVVLDENPCMVKLSNSWIIMNPGGPPTPDKPGISVVDYQPGDTTSIFLNLRVADIQACYEEWKARGAEFVTPPIDRGAEIRCYMRDPGRIPHRGRPVHWPAARQARRKAPRGPPWLSSVTGRETPASKPRSANLRWRDKLSGVSRINRGRSVRTKWGQASHQHGHDGAERRMLRSRPALPHRSPPWSPPEGPPQVQALVADPSALAELAAVCLRQPVGGEAPWLTALQEVRGAGHGRCHTPEMSGRAVCPALGPGGRWTPWHAPGPPGASDEATKSAIDQGCRACSVQVPGRLVERLRLGSGMPAPPGQIPPPWAWWGTKLPPRDSAAVGTGTRVTRTDQGKWLAEQRPIVGRQPVAELLDAGYVLAESGQDRPGMVAPLGGVDILPGGGAAGELLGVERLGGVRPAGQRRPQLTWEASGQLGGDRPADALGQGGQGRLGGPPSAVPVQASQQLDALEELRGVHAACILPDRLEAAAVLGNDRLGPRACRVGCWADAAQELAGLCKLPHSRWRSLPSEVACFARSTIPEGGLGVPPRGIPGAGWTG